VRARVLGQSHSIGMLTSTVSSTSLTSASTTTPVAIDDELTFDEINGRRRIATGSLPALVRALADANMPDQVGVVVDLMCLCVNRDHRITSMRSC
jgi:hypothetical protein